MSPGTASGFASTLRGLHRPGRPLVLPNAWDGDSARAVESAGFSAVATSSAATAESIGGHDGHVEGARMLAEVGRVTSAVAVPVTADVERGYGLDPAELVRRLAGTGAVGCNLEDSDAATGTLVDPDEQADFLRAVRAAAAAAGVDLVLNARIDSLLHPYGSTTHQLADCVARARLYLAAGADCVYPFLLDDLAAVRGLVQRVDGPVNVLCTPRVPSLEALAELGVARISFGPALYRLSEADRPAALAAIRAGANPLRAQVASR
ncbi:MAG TPA: isocitrate lyase/phosphoenolpyruvate mutase family protein [Actinomycetes bacterium]